MFAQIFFYSRMFVCIDFVDQKIVLKIKMSDEIKK
jgi:hypothetical protein